MSNQNQNQEQQQTSEQPDIVQNSAQIVKAETENAVDIAKRYPRNLQSVKNKVRMYAACDFNTAMSCFYKKPVDNQGTMAEGPSIRLAEIIANAYENIKYGSRVVDIEERFVTVQGVAHDLENNIFYTAEVKRSIWSTKNNLRFGQNMIETTIKAASAIAVRDAIYKVVPMAIFAEEMNFIKSVATGEVNPDGTAPEEKNFAERGEKALNYFENLGVARERVFKKLGIEKIEDIDSAGLNDLIGYYNAIKDNEAKPEEIFPESKQEKQENAANKGQEDIDKDLFNKQQSKKGQ